MGYPGKGVAIDIAQQWSPGEYVVVHTILRMPPSPVSELGGKPKWLPLKFGYHDVMRTSPISDLKISTGRCTS